MAITLNGITLPDGLHWVDEYSSEKVVQNVKHTLDGGAVVFYGQRQRGIPITLESVGDQGWMTRSDVVQLAALADTAGGVYNLSLRGVTYSVMFRHNEPPAFKAEPLQHFATPSSEDYYTVSIRLIIV